MNHVIRHSRRHLDLRLCHAANQAWVSEGFLEVSDLLLKYGVFTWDCCILLQEFLLVLSELLNDCILIINQRFKFLLVILLSLPAPNSWFPILKSLPSLFVLNWILKVTIGTILIIDGILKILLLFVGELIKIKVIDRYIIIIVIRVIHIILNLFESNTLGVSCLCFRSWLFLLTWWLWLSVDCYRWFFTK